MIGPNGSGKTNLLEAIMMVSLGKSYRAPDQELIMRGKEWSRIDALTPTGNRTVKLTRSGPPTKQIIIANKPYKRINTTQQLAIVLFEPNHLLMLSGSPELRRSYLDGILEQTKSGYKKLKNDYLRTLGQRNSLLKSGQANTNDIFPWNVRLSQLGGILAVARSELAQRLNQNISDTYDQLSGGNERISLVYQACVNLDRYESQMLKKLEQSFELDKLRRFTVYGPHREDMEVRINNKSPQLYASRGEARTITIALKAAELQIIEKEKNQQPIVLLDDVFSELDEKRRTALIDLLNSAQTIITATDVRMIKLPKKTNLIKLTS